MHGADVVQHVGVGEGRAQRQHIEVQAEEHFTAAPERVVLLQPEEGEVAWVWETGFGCEVGV